MMLLGHLARMELHYDGDVDKIGMQLPRIPWAVGLKCRCKSRTWSLGSCSSCSVAPKNSDMRMSWLPTLVEHVDAPSLFRNNAEHGLLSGFQCKSYPSISPKGDVGFPFRC